VLVSDFNFHLPEELIAQQPLAARDASRMLVLGRESGDYADRQFRELPELLGPGDLVVFNNTRVFPARLYGRRAGAAGQSAFTQSGRDRSPKAGAFREGRIEALLTRQVSAEPNEWECLVRPGRKIRVGEHLLFGEKDELEAEVMERGEFGERRIRFVERGSGAAQADFFATLDRIGHIPLPPYIGRADSSGDRDRYQTIYAQQQGSIAAPTAGLHFTPAILQRMRERCVETAEITLHVGLGTFQPVRVEHVEEHKIHCESYSVAAGAATAINTAVKDGRRVVAVGTTTVRTLEHAIREGHGKMVAGEAVADIFIYPGHEFKVVRALLTNFHLPQSSLLMLVSAFAGRERVLRAYEHAVKARYRFYSYGDCMFIA
jgi:S-adenosylmethionine:tRNA ribosyltransferase-isomerase